MMKYTLPVAHTILRLALFASEQFRPHNNTELVHELPIKQIKTQTVATISTTPLRCKLPSNRRGNEGHIYSL